MKCAFRKIIKNLVDVREWHYTYTAIWFFFFKGDIKAPVVVTECGGHHRFSPRSPVLRLTVSGKANCVWSFESIDFHDIYVDPIVHADQNCAHVSGHLRFETPAGTSLGRLDVCTPRGDAVQSVQPITKKLFQIRLLSSLGLEAGNFSITLIGIIIERRGRRDKDSIQNCF